MARDSAALLRALALVIGIGACAIAGLAAIHGVCASPWAAWAAWAGRATAPLLLWAVVVSLDRTRSPRSAWCVMAGLYGAGLAAAAVQTVIPTLRVDGNVFPVLLGAAAVMQCLRLGNACMRRGCVAAYLLWQIAAGAWAAQLPLLGAALGLVPGSGYGLGFVVLGAALWKSRASRLHAAVTFALCAVIDMMARHEMYGALLLGLPATLLGSWLGTEQEASATLYWLLFADPLAAAFA